MKSNWVRCISLLPTPEARLSLIGYSVDYVPLRPLRVQGGAAGKLMPKESPLPRRCCSNPLRRWRQTPGWGRAKFFPRGRYCRKNTVYAHFFLGLPDWHRVGVSWVRASDGQLITTLRLRGCAFSPKPFHISLHPIGARRTDCFPTGEPLSCLLRQAFS
jgi:hypothetical protein